MSLVRHTGAIPALGWSERKENGLRGGGDLLRSVSVFLSSLSDLAGGGYCWVSERPDRLTTAARLR